MLARATSGFLVGLLGLTVPIGYLTSAEESNVLLNALRAGDLLATRGLIERGASVDATDDLHSSALMYAAVYTDRDTMRLLLDGGANPNHTDDFGATALMWSIPDEAWRNRLTRFRGASFLGAWAQRVLRANRITPPKKFFPCQTRKAGLNS
jgi:Ankyrin repeats (3 copies)